MIWIQRREFITLLGGTAAAWPLAARAQQQPGGMRRIGVLVASATDDAESQARIAAFHQGLAQLGWSNGHNVRIDIRWATTNADELRRHAAELVALAPDVLVAATGTTTVAPLLQATRTVPIVFVVVIDPVGAGFVQSLARPGGNATGFTMLEYGQSGKWLELLKQIAPRMTRAAVLRDPAIASGIGQRRPILHRPACSIGPTGRTPHGAGDLFPASVCRGRRPDELWSKPDGCNAPGRQLCRPHPQGRQARRAAGGAVSQARADHQRANRPHAWSHRPGLAPRHCRRGNRMIRRREFITLLGGAAACMQWPQVTRAQQAGKTYRLGILSPATVSIDSIRSVTLPELAKAGFVEGQNLIVDVRVGTSAQIPELAQALVGRNLDAVIAVSDIAIGAVKAVSSSVPIVMSFGTGDPVAAGFASSITNPGGNVTGVVMLAPELNAKRLTLLHEAIPGARRIAALVVSEHRYETILQAMRTVAAGAGFELPTFFAERPGSYPGAFTAMRSAGAEALIIVSAPEFNRDAEILAALAVEANLPTVCEWSHMAAQGCLFGYGPSQTELRRRTAEYLVRIFRGIAPGDLPIEGPTRFQFAVTLRTAKRLGVELPTGLLLRADEVIE